MYLCLLVYGVSVVDIQKRMAMITERNSQTGGKINGRQLSSQIKVQFLITLWILKIPNLKNGAKCKLKILRKRLIQARVFQTILYLL